MRNPLPVIAVFGLLLVAAAGSSDRRTTSPQAYPADPLHLTIAKGIMDLAPDYRQRNQGGSCVHCSTKHLLHWVGLHDKAEEWWSRYRGGESPGPHRQKMQAMGVNYAMTTDGDMDLIEYAITSRRGAGIVWSPMHVVNLCGREMRNGQLTAVLLDNNRIGQFRYQEWNAFEREFQRRGGWAFVILDGSPPPPTPI